jgi:hypothetical protein
MQMPLSPQMPSAADPVQRPLSAAWAARGKRVRRERARILKPRYVVESWGGIVLLLGYSWMLRGAGLNMLSLQRGE